MACEDEYARMLNAPPGSDQRHQAEADFYECMRFMLSIYEARHSHSADMEEKRIQQMKKILEAWNELFGKIKPLPPKDIARSREVRNQIFRDAKTPMIFSNALSEAFQKANIKLKENEMFECTISIRERPSHVTELLSPVKAKGVPPMNFITDSTVMGQLMKEIKK